MITIEDVRKTPYSDNFAIWIQNQSDLIAAWDNCPNPNWMIWLLWKVDLFTVEHDLLIQLAMLETPLQDGRIVSDLIPGGGNLYVDLKQRKLTGETIDDNVWLEAKLSAQSSAREESWAIARAAIAATHCDTREALDKAAWAAAAMAASDALEKSEDHKVAFATYWEIAVKWQADKIREIIGNPFAGGQTHE